MSHSVVTLEYSPLPISRKRPRYLLLIPAAVGVLVTYLPFGDFGGGTETMAGVALRLINTAANGSGADILAGWDLTCINLLLAPAVVIVLVRACFWKIHSIESAMGYSLSLVCGLSVILLDLRLGIQLMTTALAWSDGLVLVAFVLSSSIFLFGTLLWVRLIMLQREEMALCVTLITSSIANACCALTAVLPGWMGGVVKPGAALCLVQSAGYLAVLIVLAFQARSHEQRALT
jgi:hypothetical protein